MQRVSALLITLNVTGEHQILVESAQSHIDFFNGRQKFLRTVNQREMCVCTAVNPETERAP